MPAGIQCRVREHGDADEFDLIQDAAGSITSAAAAAGLTAAVDMVAQFIGLVGPHLFRRETRYRSSQDRIGIERFHPGHVQGSTHGKTRIFRVEGEMNRDQARAVLGYSYVWDWEIVQGS